MKFEPTTLHWCLSCQKLVKAKATEQETPYPTEGKVMQQAYYDCGHCGTGLEMAYHWHKKQPKAT